LTHVCGNYSEKVKDFSYEKLLLEKFREGDKTAFSTIFSVYYSDLVMFAATFLNDLDSSQEVVQDIFVKFWEDRQSIFINTSLKSYLLKSTQNKCLDWIKHSKVKSNYCKEIIHSTSLLDFNTENYVLKSELEFNIDKALDQLPKEISESFRLNRYEGLKYHEIAEKLNVSQRTIEVRIGKALQALRDHLKDYLITLFIYLMYHI
jgi:RNA polymerase sigma-70 factor, ECF subfamily